METTSKNAYMRLKKVLLNDKDLPNGLIMVLKSDLTEVFSSYFDYNYDNLALDITVDTDGRYQLNIALPIERIKNLKVL